MDAVLREFLTETSDALDVLDVELIRFERDATNTRIVANIFRHLHTIKGSCGFLGLHRLEALAHAGETLMAQLRDGEPATGGAIALLFSTIDRIRALLLGLERSQREPAGTDFDIVDRLERMIDAGRRAAFPRPPAAGPSRPVPPAHEGPRSALPALPAPPRAPGPPDEARAEPADRPIRINAGMLDHLTAMVGELVLTQNDLLDFAKRHGMSELKGPLQRFSAITAALGHTVASARVQPVGTAWRALPRIARDLGRSLGKDIELVIDGADTELDRQVLDLIKDPVVHMVRNAADHGIETPDERRALGKPSKGVIRVSACREGDDVLLRIADDGRGLDAGRIKARAAAAGLAAAADVETMSDARARNFIFTPGFSTAARVTNVSGRGVGMDVVRTNISRIGGSIEVNSVPGEGASFIIRVPATGAVAGEPASLPLGAPEALAPGRERGLPPRPACPAGGTRSRSEAVEDAA